MNEKKNPSAALGVLYAAAFLAAFNSNVVSVVLPRISTAMQVSPVTSQWLVSGYMMVQAVVIAVYAGLSTRVRTRRMFLGAVLTFAAGQVGCLLAPTFAVMLPFRLLQACGGGVLIPMMMGGVMALAPRQQLGRFLAIGTAAITVGPALAPVLSGLMASRMGWRSVFVLPLVIMAVVGVGGLLAMPDIPAGQRTPIDLVSVLLVAGLLCSFVAGMGRITAGGMTGAILLAVAVVLACLFAWRELHLSTPLLDVRLLSRAGFALPCVLLIFSIMQNFSMSLLLPAYFQAVHGVSPLTAGFLLVPPVLVMSLFALGSGRLVDQFGLWPLVPLGFVALVLGQVLVSAAGNHRSMTGVILAAVLVFGAAGVVQAPIQAAALRTVQPGERGSAVSLVNVFIQTGSAIGPALFIGIRTSSSAHARAGGALGPVAQAHGFSTATVVAAVIAVAGLALSVPVSRRRASTDAVQAG